MNNEELTREEYLKFQNSRWTNRRRMAWASLVFYFAISVVAILRVPSESFDNYEGYFLQLSLFVGMVITNYFVSNSAEAIKADRHAIIDEYKSLRSMSKERDRGSQRRTRRNAVQTQQYEDDESEG